MTHKASRSEKPDKTAKFICITNTRILTTGQGRGLCEVLILCNRAHTPRIHAALFLRPYHALVTPVY